MRLLVFCLGLLLALGVPGTSGFAQTTLADNFDWRTGGTSDLSPVSPEGLSWSVAAGGVRVDNLVAQTDVSGSRAMVWPRANGAPLDTLVIANEISDWNSLTMDFGWSSKYVRKTAGMLLLYKDPDNFYFIRLASLTDGELIRRMGGVETLLARGDFEPPDVGDTVVTSYRFEVSASAAGILIRVDRGIDGTVELEYTDSDSGALSTLGGGGRIGLRCLADNGTYHLVYIDRISVTGAHVDLGQPLPTATPTVTNTQAAPPTPTNTSAIPPTPTFTAAGPATPTRTPTPTLLVDQTGQPGRVDPVTDLAVAPSARPGGYRLTWTAPDGNLDLAGMQAAAAYDIRYSASPITSEGLFSAAAKLPNTPDPWIGGLAQSVECFSLPGGPLHFRMKVIGTNVSALSNAVSGSPSSGSAQWAVPANRKVGIDLRVAGVESADYVYEVLFYDTNIDDHGVLYVRDSVEMTLAHNAKNSKPAQLWTGGQPGISPAGSVEAANLAGDSGVIRYRFDSDGLRYWDGKQAYVQNGQCYGTDRWKSHPMFKQYTGAFTPKTFYDSIESDGIATPAERVGQINGSDVDSRYSKGYTDPNSGDEWHELAYWDDDRGWIGSNERHAQASDGRVVWIVLNPKTPALSFNAGSGGRFFTTRPKSYFQGRVNPQTTSFSGDVTLTLTNLSPNPGPVQYRIAGGNWTDASGPIALSTLNLAVNTPTEFEFRIGANGPIKRRTLVREPVIATANETHPVIICRAEERAALLDRILANTDLANEYKKLKSNGNQIKGLMGRNYEIDERIRFGGVAGQAMSAAFVYFLEGTGAIRDSTYTGAEIARKAFRTLLAILGSYDNLGDESQAGQWSGPNGEVTFEWWDRGFNCLHAQTAYDLLAGFSEIDPIDDLKLREALAQESYVKMKFIPEIRGNWNLKSSMGLLASAYTMPTYDSPVFGGATVASWDGAPFTPPVSWQRYVEDADLPQGQPNGPKLNSTLWDSVWEDGVSKESTSYDASGRTVLAYFLNMFAGYHNRNLMDTHPEFRRMFEWSIRARVPWDRKYPSYGQARYTILQDCHLVMNKRFEDHLDMGVFRWHYTRHQPALGINPNGIEPIPYVVAWHDPTYPVTTPWDTGSKCYHNNMVFQRDYPDANTAQLLLWGRETSWTSYEAHRKDDSTAIFLNAFGEKFLQNTDEPADWIRSNPESQNVILVDDTTPGPTNQYMAGGPSRATIATMKANLVSPFIDYGMMASQLNCPNDQSYYKTKAQLDRHVLFPDHRFFIVLDDMKAPDNQSHSYGWTGHCNGTLDISTPQRATFTKASGRRLDIHFFGPSVTFENYTIAHAIEWSGSEIPVPYFIAKTSGVGTQYLSALIPIDLGGSTPTYEPVSVSRGTAGRVSLDGAEYLVFCQPEPLQEVTVDGRLRTSAKLALAKTVGGNLEYLFASDQAGALYWPSTPGMPLNLPERRNFLFLPRDPVTLGPSITTTADGWMPD